MGNLENQFAEFKTRNETLEVTLKDKVPVSQSCYFLRIDRNI